MACKVALVTGAAGFIGRWSVPRLIEAGYEVHAVVGRTLLPAFRGDQARDTLRATVDVVTGRAVPAQLAGAQIHCADLLDGASSDALLRLVKPTHLLHFAWIATPGVYWTSADNYRWVTAGERLLHRFEAGGGVRAVLAGSCAEYDWSRVGQCHEFTSPLAGADGAAITPYAECKLAMQAALARWSRASGLSAAWGRIFFQFGPDEHPQRLVASVIRNLLQGREAPCSHGRQIRSFLHVADLGSAFAALLDSGIEGPVNVGSGDPISLADLLGRIAAQIGRPELLRLGARAAAASEPALLVPDVERLQRGVGWRPRFGLDEGITDTINWWRNAEFW
jgi:nucleoside-diphosphate-sugar epimerase